MALIFDSVPGVVVAITDPAMQGVIPLVALEPGQGSEFSFQNQKSLITGMTVAQEANYQFLHSLGNEIYIYVFGDRIGQMTISGLCAASTCDNTEDQYGFEQVMQWYEANKVSARKTAVTAMIGSTAISGFVVGMNGSIVEPKQMLMQFSLSLMILPVNKS